MGYAEYIRVLLRPVGIYAFVPGNIGNGEIESIGTALDDCEAVVEEGEREALVPTAEDWGLALREALFAKRPAAPTWNCGVRQFWPCCRSAATALRQNPSTAP